MLYHLVGIFKAHIVLLLLHLLEQLLQQSLIGLENASNIVLPQPAKSDKFGRLHAVAHLDVLRDQDL